MSRLKPYSFPAFYTCYLLKSARTPRSYKNYIGFTRDPLLRLHQHNGIRPGGARGTALHRPWAMQLLVHGFPSPPAALIFEYAWQNPHKSRYTRNEAGFLIHGESGKALGQNIMILQTMIRLFPFSKWPLHVQLFTEEAACYWVALASTSPSSSYYVSSSDSKSRQFGDELIKEQTHNNAEMLFPPGFTFSIELNSVNRSKKLPRSRRKGPLRTTDDQLTGPYLAKTKALIISSQPSLCSICAEPVNDLANDHFKTAICTHADCTSVTHIQCLAKSWLDGERSLCSQPTSFFSNPSCSPSAPPSPVSSDYPLVDLPASALPASTVSTLSSALSSTRLPPSALLASLTGASTAQCLHNGTNNSPNLHQLPIPTIFGLGKGMFPRGGICNSCGTYTLWGDIMKGCFMRSTSHEARKGEKMSPQTTESASAEFSDSGAGSPWLTQFDTDTLQDVSRKRRVKSTMLRSGKLPRKEHVLAQKAELDLARQSVDNYRDVIRRKQVLVTRKFSVATTHTPRGRGRPRKIAVSTTTTTVVPLKKRGLGKPKKTLALAEPSLPIPPVATSVKKRVRAKAKKS